MASYPSNLGIRRLIRIRTEYRAFHSAEKGTRRGTGSLTGASDRNVSRSVVFVGTRGHQGEQSRFGDDSVSTWAEMHPGTHGLGVCGATV